METSWPSDRAPLRHQSGSNINSIVIMNPQSQKTPDRFTAMISLLFKSALLTLLGVMFLCGPCASAQTLKLKFGFEDTGTSTADSVSGVSLNIISSTGTAAELHGAAGTGVAGQGKALDLTSAPGSTGTAPYAFTTAN